MGNLGHQAARLAASKICDNIVKGLCKDPETEVVKLIDMWQKFMGDEKIDLNYDSARKMICDKDCTLNKYMHRLINEIDPHVLKTIALNLGFEAFVYGTKTIRKNREKYGCNVPWLILMDPTSACNLHCTGCWAAEYGHKLNLTFDEMDKVVTQGKELGVYLYMFTGGEPLVRKSDLVKLCEKHSDCAFLAFTNGTLVDEAFCADLKRIGNLYLAISLEGFSEVNDLRRGTGVFAKVMHAMDLLKENGLVFGTSICYTSKNYKTVTSDEFIDMIVEKNNMHDFDSSMFFRWIFKSAFAILIVTNTWNIVMGVFDATQQVVNQSAGVIIGDTSIDFDTLLPDLESRLEAMDIGPLLGLWFQTLVVGLTMNILSICIFLVTYGRMIEIYAVTALGPIPLATLGNAEWRGMGQNYLKSLLALGFQAFLIMVVVGIYAVLIQQIGTADDISGAIWGCMGYTVLLCFCLFKTGSISKAVFTAH